METRLEQAEARLSEGIYQSQQIAVGSVIVALEKREQVPLMRERLKLFAACVRGNGGEACFKGNESINYSLY